MTRELEDRLERLADTLPMPTADSRDRARDAALGAAPQARRRRRVLLIPAIVIALAAVAGAILAAPWGDGPLAIQRALAAFGNQPVVHAIVEEPTSRWIAIDLETGEERLMEGQRTEYWYDDERDYLRARVTLDGRVLRGGEYLHTPEGFFTDVQASRAGPPMFDPALQNFASGYRAALENGEATVVGEEIVDGHEAVILRFALPVEGQVVQPFQEVAVDASTYRPLRFRFFLPVGPAGKRPWSEAARIVEIETIPHDPGDFKRPEAGGPRPAGQTGVPERTLTPEEAATALGRPAFWPGSAVEGLEITKIQLTRLTTKWTDGHKTQGHALVFQYGADRRTAHLEGRPSLIITESTSAEESRRAWFFPPQGELQLAGLGYRGGDVEGWVGAMQRDGVYMTFESRRRELIIAAARSLRPLP